MRRLIPVLLAAALLPGCAVLGEDPIRGILFTSTTVPYTVDLDATPVPKTSGAGSIVRIREPITDFGIYTELNTNAIGEIARKHGLETVHFADLKTFSLFSVWRTHTLIIYGE